MRLHNKNSNIMRGKEGSPKPEKSINVFRIIYYLLLFSLLGYIIIYFVLRQITIKGEGFVVFDVVNIEAPFNGKIVDLNASQYVKKGEYLCNIEERIKNNIPIIRQISSVRYTQAYFKLLDLKAQYKITKELYKNSKKELKKLNALRSLELYNPKEIMYQNIKNKVDNLKIKLATLKIQIKAYEKLPLKISKPVIKNTTPLYSNIKYPIYSLATGNLLQSVNNNDVVKAGDIIFTIQTNKNLKIVTYFSQRYIDELKKGDKITIILPDNVTEKGYITDITVNSVNLNYKTLQKLKVTIIPINKNIKFWKKYSLLRLKVRKYKW